MKKQQETEVKRTKTTTRTKETVVSLKVDIVEAKVALKFIGTAPLIVNRFGAKAIRQILAKHTGVGMTKREPKSPIADFEDSRIKNERGEDCIPWAWPKCAIVDVAGRFGSNNKVRSHTRAAIKACGETYPLEYGGKPEIRSDVVRNDNGQPDIRFRAQFREWSFTAPFLYNPNLISLATLLEMANLAGSAIGFGEWRPDKNGRNGTFQVEPVSVTDAAFRKLVEKSMSPLTRIQIPDELLYANLNDGCPDATEFDVAAQ